MPAASRAGAASLVLLLAIAAPPAMACLPGPGWHPPTQQQIERKIREDYRAAQNAIEVEVISDGNFIPDAGGLRVRRVYKGTLKPGARLRLGIGLSTSCADPRTVLRTGTHGLVYLNRYNGRLTPSFYVTPEQIAVLRRAGLLPAR